MQFWQYRTTRACIRSLSPREEGTSVGEFYTKTLKFSAFQLHDAACMRQQVLEGSWELDKCPYYRVYPSIIPLLLRLNLALDVSLIKLPLRVFAVHFPKAEHKLTFEVDGVKYPIRSLLCGPATLRQGEKSYEGISIWSDFGETMGTADLNEQPIIKDFPILTYINMPVQKGMSVEAASTMLHNDPSATYGIRMPPLREPTLSGWSVPYVCSKTIRLSSSQMCLIKTERNTN